MPREYEMIPSEWAWRQFPLGSQRDLSPLMSLLKKGLYPHDPRRHLEFQTLYLNSKLGRGRIGRRAKGNTFQQVRIQSCYCGGLDRCCVEDLVPGLGTSTAQYAFNSNSSSSYPMKNQWCKCDLLNKVMTDAKWSNTWLLAKLGRYSHMI